MFDKRELRDVPEDVPAMSAAHRAFPSRTCVAERRVSKGATPTQLWNSMRRRQSRTTAQRGRAAAAFDLPCG